MPVSSSAGLPETLRVMVSSPAPPPTLTFLPVMSSRMSVLLSLLVA